MTLTVSAAEASHHVNIHDTDCSVLVSKRDTDMIRIRVIEIWFLVSVCWVGHTQARADCLITGRVCDSVIVINDCVSPAQTMRRQRTEVVVELRKVRCVHAACEGDGQNAC